MRSAILAFFLYLIGCGHFVGTHLLVHPEIIYPQKEKPLTPDGARDSGISTT